MSNELINFVITLTEREKTVELAGFWASHGRKVESGEWTKKIFLEKFKNHILSQRLQEIA